MPRAAPDTVCLQPISILPLACCQPSRRPLLLLATPSATRASSPGRQSRSRKQIPNCHSTHGCPNGFVNLHSCYPLYPRGRGTHLCSVRRLQMQAPLMILASQCGVDGGLPDLCCQGRSFVGSLCPESHRFSDSRDQPLRTWPVCVSGD